MELQETHHNAVPELELQDIINNKISIFFISTSINSRDWEISNSLSKNIENSSVITDINKIKFLETHQIIIMDYTLLEKINLNQLKCIKIAWVINCERKWLNELNNFDYVLCSNNKVKKYYESNAIKSYILPIGSNFDNVNFYKRHNYDILLVVNLFNRREIVDYIIRLKKTDKYKIKIIGKNLDNYLNRDELNLIKEDYYGFINEEDIKNNYLDAKIIIDDCNINTIEFGSLNKTIVDCISCKRLVITNNMIASNELFDNKLITYDSYESLINVIDTYLNNEKEYNDIVNQLYEHSKQFNNNKNYKHVFYNLNIFEKNNVKTDLVIKICGNRKENFTFTDSYQMDDFVMAGNIKKELYNRYGLCSQICLINDWYNYDIYNCNNVLFLRGINIYNPNPKNNNMVMFLSHPESYTHNEFNKYNKIICCSKLFYEKIKTKLKLKEDDIIFALQPIEIPHEVEINKETKILYDALFIGNKIRERECISWLTKENFNKVKIFGKYWDDYNHIEPVILNIKSIEYNVHDLNCKSKIILNDTRTHMNHNWFINNRVLYGLISGNFVLTDNIKKIKDFKFANIYTFNNVDNLNSNFKYLKDKTIDKKGKETNINILKQNNNEIFKFIYLKFYYNYDKWMINNADEFKKSGSINRYKVEHYINSSNVISPRHTQWPSTGISNNDKNANNFIDISEISKYNPTKKVGFIITTYGNCGVFVDKLVESINHFIGDNKFIVVYINEKADDQTFNLSKKYDNIELIFIENQYENHGLTGTWNQGIDLCFKNDCEIIILANNDIFITSDISYIIDESIKCSINELYYYGPVTNNPGGHNYQQYSNGPCYKPIETCYQDNKIWNLNGFFLVFPKHVLVKNKIGDLYFDNNFPFEENEVEWHNRFLKIGGLPKVVYKTFVYHYKLKKWRKENIENDTCIFTIITGGYENSLHNHHKNNSSNMDFYCFTDNLNLVFECIKNNIYPILIFDQNKKLTQRTIKTSCHKYLPMNYKTSIYIDGNVIYFDNVIKNLDINKFEMICCEHPNKKKSRVIQEIQDVIKLNLGREEDINKILNIMKTNNFEDNVGLTETSFLIRNNTKNIIEMNEEWTKMINICHRDQISFDYLKWKYKIKYHTIDREHRPIFKVSHSDITNRNIK